MPKYGGSYRWKIITRGTYLRRNKNRNRFRKSRNVPDRVPHIYMAPRTGIIRYVMSACLQGIGRTRGKNARVFVQPKRRAGGDDGKRPRVE